MRTNKRIIEVAKRVKSILGLEPVKQILNVTPENRTEKQQKDMMAHAAIDSMLKILNVMKTKDIVEN